MTVPDPGGHATAAASHAPLLALANRRPLLGPPAALPGGRVALTIPGEAVSLHDAEGQVSVSSRERRERGGARVREEGTSATAFSPGRRRQRIALAPSFVFRAPAAHLTHTIPFSRITN